MLEIARFYGMIVKMFFRGGEHNPPHIHIEYSGRKGTIDITTLQFMQSDLPTQATNLALKWATLYQSELLEIWNTQNFRKLPPLE